MNVAAIEVLTQKIEQFLVVVVEIFFGNVGQKLLGRISHFCAQLCPVEVSSESILGLLAIALEMMIEMHKWYHVEPV